jgi:hypothetical protein
LREAEAIRILEDVVQSIPTARRQSAKSFHDAVDLSLVQRGWRVHREFRAPRRGDDHGGGLIDLVITSPIRMAIEIDNISPRQKSLFKLRDFVGLRVVILRTAGGRRNWNWEDVVVIVAGGHSSLQ